MPVELCSHLFRADPESSGEFIVGHFPDLKSAQKEVWEAEWTMGEAKKAFSEMGSWEAPGPDGYQPGFFKGTWEITSHKVYNFDQAVLNGGEVTNEDAKALLVLVPKVVKPSSLKNFC